ncbi:MAG: DUF192 domain-containing protein [Patescibacteria group bacterium]
MVFPRKYQILIGILEILTIAVVIVLLTFQKIKTNSYPYSHTVRINNRVVLVDLATNPVSQYKGLSNRESLCSDCGMLFIFPDKQIRSFVMREMNFPLDIIFVNDNKIVNIEEKLKPEGSDPINIYKSIIPVDKVLELPSSYTEKYKIKVGDEILID